MNTVNIIGGGLAGSEAALRLADLGFNVTLHEMRPDVPTPVHRSGNMAELVCSNSFKSKKPDTAAGMLKAELEMLASPVYQAALDASIDAGGALAVDREAFSQSVTAALEAHPRVQIRRGEVASLREAACDCDAVILATGPLTADALADDLAALTGTDKLAFYDAAAPIVMADSVDRSIAFRQNRYEETGAGDYLNCPFDKDAYDAFIRELVGAERVMKKDFESKDLFQACQPIEEIARKGADAPRFGTMKPVGLTDPASGRRPWAAVQLRAEDAAGQSYNLVGFQTNLTFPEQRRVFRMIPGLEHAEFARYGVMHRNTYLNSPRVLDVTGRLTVAERSIGVPIFVAGQLAGTEGYTEAIRSGAHVGLSVAALLRGIALPAVPSQTAFGALMRHATDPAAHNYQPSHVNFGIMPPLAVPIRAKRERYAAFAERGRAAMEAYVDRLAQVGLLSVKGEA